MNGSYSVPWGNWTFSASGGTSEYRQNVAMSGQDLRYRGRNTNLDVEVERVIHRGQASKTTASLSAAKRWGQTWLEDVEIEVQRRDVTSATLRLGTGTRPGGPPSRARSRSVAASRSSPRRIGAPGVPARRSSPLAPDA